MKRYLILITCIGLFTYQPCMQSMQNAEINEKLQAEELISGFGQGFESAVQDLQSKDQASLTNFQNGYWQAFKDISKCLLTKDKSPAYLSGCNKAIEVQKKKQPEVKEEIVCGAWRQAMTEEDWKTMAENHWSGYDNALHYLKTKDADYINNFYQGYKQAFADKKAKKSCFDVAREQVSKPFAYVDGHSKANEMIMMKEMVENKFFTK